MSSHGGAQEGISYLLRELGSRDEREQRYQAEISRLHKRIELLELRLAKARKKR